MAGQDPYFRLSKYMRAQVRRNADYLVQPGDPRFNILYPQHAKDKNRQEDLAERKTFEDIQSRY